MQKYNIWKQLLGAVSVLLSLQIHAQNPVAEGANSLGLTDTTVWAGNSNPANLSQLNSTIVGFGARNSYILPELSRYYAAAAMRAGSSVVAADLQYFGFSVWQETSAGVSVSRKLMQTVSLSAKLTYQYIGHGKEKSSSSFYIPQLFASVNVNEFTDFQIQLSPAVWAYGEELPWQEYALSVGCGYRFSPQFSAFADGAMPESGKLRVSVGAQYAAHQFCTIRVGAATDDFPLAAGISAGKSAVTFDISCRYHRYLGTGLSCGLRLKL